jgi:hypothetical protein
METKLSPNPNPLGGRTIPNSLGGPGHSEKDRGMNQSAQSSTSDPSDQQAASPIVIQSLIEVEPPRASANQESASDSLQENPSLGKVKLISPEDLDQQGGEHQSASTQRLATSSRGLSVFPGLGGSVSNLSSASISMTDAELSASSTNSGESVRPARGNRRFLREVVLIALALCISLGAVIAAGTIVFSLSKESLRISIGDRGHALLRAASNELEVVHQLLPKSVTECLNFYRFLNVNFTDFNTSFAAASSPYLRNFGTRIQDPGEQVIGWTGSILFPPVERPPTSQNNDSGCVYLCRGPDDPVFTSGLHLGVWREKKRNGDNQYVFAQAAPGGTVGRIYGITSGLDPQIAFYAYNYTYINTIRNGTRLNGIWQAPYPWLTFDGRVFYHITFGRTEYIDHTAVMCNAHVRVVDLHHRIQSILPTSTDEILLLADSNRKLLTSSQAPEGDVRYANCSFVASGLLVACADLNVMNHPDPFIRYLFAALDSASQSSTGDTDGSPLVAFEVNGVKWNALQQVVFSETTLNQAKFHIRAVWAIQESVVYAKLDDTSTPSIIVSVCCVVLACVTLAIIARIFVRNATMTTRAAEKVVAHIASYDLDGARRELSGPAAEGILLQDEFDRLLQNLEAYRPFLPPALLHRRRSPDFHETSKDLMLNYEGEGELEEGQPQDGATTGGAVFNRRLAMSERYLFRSVKATVLLIRLFVSQGAGDLKVLEKAAKLFSEASLEVVEAFGGSPDVLRSTQILVSFNAHRTVVHHAETAGACAYATAAALQTVMPKAVEGLIPVHGSDAPSITWTLSVCSGIVIVGTCGNSRFKARVVDGPPVQEVSRMAEVQHLIGCRIALNDVAAKVVSFPVLPVDLIALSPDGDGSTVPVKKRSSRFLKSEVSSSASSSRTTVSGSPPPPSDLKGVRQVALYQLLYTAPSEDVLETFTTAFWESYAGQLSDAHEKLSKLATRLSPSVVGEEPSHSELSHQVQRLLAVMLRGLEQRQESLNARAEPRVAPQAGELPYAVDPYKIPEELVTRHRPSQIEPALNELMETANAHTEKLKGMKQVETGLVPLLVSPEPQSPLRPGTTTSPTKLSNELPRFIRASDGHTWTRFPKEIGVGSFCRVYRAAEASTGKQCAIKAIPLIESVASIDSITQEVEALRRCSHRNIVSYIASAVTKTHFCILMDYVPTGSIAQLLEGIGPFSTDFLLKVTEDVMEGLQYLHEKDLIHCDLKPENILLGQDSTCMLSDLGSSSQTFSRSKSSVAGLEVRGTVRYMAPECLSGHYTPACDIWSFGITLLELLTGGNPWLGWKTEQDLFLHLKDEQFVPKISLLRAARESNMKKLDQHSRNEEDGSPLRLGSNVSSTESILFDMAARCCRRNPAERPTVSDILRTIGDCYS